LLVSSCLPISECSFILALLSPNILRKARYSLWSLLPYLLIATACFTKSSGLASMSAINSFWNCSNSCCDFLLLVTSLTIVSYSLLNARLGELYTQASISFSMFLYKVFCIAALCLGPKSFMFVKSSSFNNLLSILGFISLSRALVIFWCAAVSKSAPLSTPLIPALLFLLLFCFVSCPNAVSSTAKALASSAIIFKTLLVL